MKNIKAKKKPFIDWKPVDHSLPKFIAIVRESDVPLLAYSLSTLMKQVITRPKFWLIGDSESAYTKLKLWFDNAPADVIFWNWLTLFKQLDTKSKVFIETWVNSGRWGGYAKKFAVTLAANAHSDTLIFDSDVLWFGDFVSALDILKYKHYPILAGKDYAQAYDLDLVKFLGDNRLLEGDPLNCGLVYYRHHIILDMLTPDDLMNLLPYAKAATNHLEQTIVAYIFWQSNGTWFDFSTVATTLSDQLNFRNKVQSIARHYAGAKHLFWRDA
ncbi:MAG: hypothetical protein J7545_00760 [Roseofilum sp. SBFL]|uniref:hypothetical protein n=1 Tax=unclassified Roseofilum TaxID=2620099 RepID=UPI001B08A161|nr:MULTISPECIES: hypothetical protein [unclassified Roseofilum]MBP0014392.1 hypothetical protein [Roseofilum sp. SID3]MBP0025957.1 hypothetical protein [Roseofilum sp. SID2]MBP0036129.1 hypothetical protein [Roseofilum sp. SID1]MBP0040497.1 hypothetical protein [Roseofilum sp. SBFL]